jgi:hypothetical protein
MPVKFSAAKRRVRATLRYIIFPHRSPSKTRKIPHFSKTRGKGHFGSIILRIWFVEHVIVALCNSVGVSSAESQT